VEKEKRKLVELRKNLKEKLEIVEKDKKKHVDTNGNLIIYLKRKKYIIKMSRFISIVKNYEKVCRLGQDIINHKDLVRKAKPDKLSEEFRKQEERIERFAEEINKANAEWRKNPESINTYWTGWS
jgi:GTP cyclohydrolase FolE2